MKFEDIITREFNELLEMNDPTDKKIKAIAGLVDNNDHSGAILVGLNLLGTDSLVKGLTKKLEKIMDEHDKLGHLPQGLINDRTAIMKKMFSIAEKRMDGDKFSAFKGAF